MSVAEHCVRCGAWVDPEAIRAACQRCAEREERRSARAMTAVLVCTTLAVVISAWQMLTA